MQNVNSEPSDTPRVPFNQLFKNYRLNAALEHLNESHALLRLLLHYFKDGLRQLDLLTNNLENKSNIETHYDFFYTNQYLSLINIKEEYDTVLRKFHIRTYRR